ncbi:MAG: hypothetical protein K2N14_03310 [Clostridia bacterium]|nr:hypothetical protein [Clostridia bacterium]
MEFLEFADIAEAFFIFDVYKRYLWVYLFIGGGCFAVLHIFKAIALYTIAKNEGFKNKWMAFIPFFSTYYVGVVSDKNNVFKTKAKTLSLAAAMVEAVACALSAVYYVAAFAIFKGGYAEPQYTTGITVGGTYEIPNGLYDAVNLPESLNWAWWIAMYFPSYVTSWLEVAYKILNVFVLISFFRTYAPSRHILFSILCLIFPITGIIMFAVRNNRGRNYFDYLREQQQRQYRMYQDYMRGQMNGQNGYYGGMQGDPYSQQQHREMPPEDPFGGLGESGNDPFDQFKK